MTICPVGAESFHGDGRTDSNTWTDMTKLTLALHTFVNTPKMNAHETWA